MANALNDATQKTLEWYGVQPRDNPTENQENDRRQGEDDVKKSQNSDSVLENDRRQEGDAARTEREVREVDMNLAFGRECGCLCIRCTDERICVARIAMYVMGMFLAAAGIIFLAEAIGNPNSSSPNAVFCWGFGVACLFFFCGVLSYYCCRRCRI